MDTHKTVKEAINAYTSLRRSPKLMLPMKSVLDEMMRSGSNIELHNGSFEDALWLTGTMICFSMFSFCMIIGQGVDLFLGALRNDVTDMLSRFNHRKGFARVVLVSETPSPILEEFKKQYPEVFDFRQTTAKRGMEELVRHFTVTDLKSYRLEYPHGPITENTDSCSIQAKVCFNGPAIATERTQYFNQVWDYLTDSEA